MYEVGKNMGAVITGFFYHSVDRVFIQFQYPRGSSNPVAFSRAVNYHLDSLRRIFAAEESCVPSFREPFLAGFALQKLAFLFAVGSALDDVSLTPQSVMNTGFIYAEVLIDVEHAFSPLI